MRHPRGFVSRGVEFRLLACGALGDGRSGGRAAKARGGVLVLVLAGGEGVAVRDGGRGNATHLAGNEGEADDEDYWRR